MAIDAGSIGHRWKLVNDRRYINESQRKVNPSSNKPGTAKNGTRLQAQVILRKSFAFKNCGTFGKKNSIIIFFLVKI